MDNIERVLTVSPETFTSMLNGLVASGVAFTAIEYNNGLIKITFTGGY